MLGISKGRVAGYKRERGAGLKVGTLQLYTLYILMTIIWGLYVENISILRTTWNTNVRIYCKMQGNFLACFKQIKIKQTLGVVTTS